MGKTLANMLQKGGKESSQAQKNNELSFFGANSAAKKSRKKGDFSSRKKFVAKSQKLQKLRPQ